MLTSAPSRCGPGDDRSQALAALDTPHTSALDDGPLHAQRLREGVRPGVERGRRLRVPPRRTREPLWLRALKLAADPPQVFHEGLKSWSCCKEKNKPVMEFDQFMAIPVSLPRCSAVRTRRPAPSWETAGPPASLRASERAA